MKKTRIIFLIVTLALLTSCGQNNSVVSSENTYSVSDTNTGVYEDLLKNDHVVLDDAFNQLASESSLEPDAKMLFDELSILKKCEGAFAHEYETTGNRYAAEVSFYLQKGESYCSVEYSGYMGTIKDGLIKESDDPDYRYMTETKGDLFGREQDFSIHFSEETLRIQWAETCDYILTRGDGSVEYAQDYRTPFEETDSYRMIIELVDKVHKDAPHKVEYDSDAKELNIYVEAPESTRSTIAAHKSELQESWERLVNGWTEFGGKLYQALHVGNNGEHVNIYMVDSLDSPEEYVLWVDNDTVKYNLMEDESIDQAGSPSQSSQWQQKESADSSGNDSNGLSQASTGERNALSKAKQYLDYTAFSHSGLIEQLEYEGFSHSEAQYGADNCGANWKEQAAKKAKDYLEYTAFSYAGLIDQLEYEGFTSDEAQYGVDNCGANWKEQAAEKARQYLEYSSFSRSELIDQLVFEGFTHEQAEYGANKAY